MIRQTSLTQTHCLININRMKRLLALLLLLVTLPVCADGSTPTPANHRPKVAVVLAGGGAKGIAHISALKAIEDAGLPVDMVVGTSIGSIVGGMYCTGYSPDTMRQIVRQTDWIKMITDNPDFGKTSINSKIADESYVLRFSLDRTRLQSRTGRGGMIHGVNIERFFSYLTRFLPDTLDFCDMPIPFACVGTNAVTGECKVFESGNVPRSMRASMAIPTVFTPVTIDSAVYVDGFVCDNFPVDVARRMGADIIIGVDLVTPKEDAQLTSSPIDLLMNCIDLYSQERYSKNIADADIYIPIDVTGYSAASFGPEALDSLLCRGEYYSALKRASLDSLRNALHLTDEPTRIRIGSYSFAKAHVNTSSWSTNAEEQATHDSYYKRNHEQLNNAFSLGGRFDNVEFASLLLNANLVLSQRKSAQLVFQMRLGERLEAKVDINRRLIGSQRMGLNYKYQMHDIAMHQSGDKMLDMKMRHHKFNYYLTQSWHNVKYTFGINYNTFRYSDILQGTDFIKIDKNAAIERYFSYYIRGEVNTLDYQYFATKGLRLDFCADLITDNLLAFQGKRPMPIFSISLQNSFRITDRFSVSPHAYARIMLSKDIDQPLSLMNMIGGLFSEQHYMQQYSMAGMYKMELIDEDGLGLVGLTGQYQPFKNHYIRLTADVCTHTNHIQDALASESVNWGINASYNIRTPLGPLAVKAYWNDLTHSFAMWLNAGYYF